MTYPIPRFIRYSRAQYQFGNLEGVQSAIRSQSVDSDDNYGDATCDKLTVTLTGPIDEGDRILFKDSTGTWVEWVVKVPDTVRAGSIPVTTAKCVSSFEYDLEGKWIDQIENKDIKKYGWQPSNLLTMLLTGTIWSVGTVDPSTPQMTENGELDKFEAYKQDATSALHQLCKVYGYEMYPTITCDINGVTQRAVNLVKRRGNPNPVWRFDYHRDLKEIRRTYAGKRVLTKAHIFGKGKPIMNELNVFTGHYNHKITIADVNNGKDYLEDEGLIPLFGTPGPNGQLVHTEGRIDFEQCESVTDLLELGRKAFNEQKIPKINYEASVLALARAGMDFGGCNVGDAVQIVDRTFSEPLQLEGRVLEIEEDLLKGPDSIRLSIGNTVATRGSAVSHISSTVQQMNMANYQYSQLVGGSKDAIEVFLDRFNAVLNAVGGYTYITENDGIWIYSMEKSQAEQSPSAWAMHLGGGYFQIANEKNLDGSWKWQTAADGNGVAAKKMITGGVGSSDDDYANIGATSAAWWGDGSSSSIAGQGIVYVQDNSETIRMLHETTSGGFIMENVNDSTSSEVIRMTRSLIQLLSHSANNGLLSLRLDSGGLKLQNGSGASSRITVIPYGHLMSYVHRLINPNDGQHMWTIDESEVATMVSNGWQEEANAGFYAFT